MDKIVARIDELRRLKGLTKKALIAKMGVPPSTFNNWFYDGTVPTFSHVENACKALDVTIEQFFSGMGAVDNRSEQEFLDYWRTMGDNEKASIRKVIETCKELRKVQHD